MFFLMSLAALGALYPVYYDALNQHVGGFPTGAAYLFQLFLPLALLVLLSMIFVKATAGVRS